MKFNVVVATHHKTGTVWMSAVFSAIAKELGASYIDFWSHYGRLDPLLRTPFILFNYDSTFRQHSGVLARDDVRILHLIRDPRDVLISAMHYHKTADEAWLHKTVPGCNDIPYQRKLNSFATPFEQYLFELENASSSTIEDMLDWRYDRANCLEIRYEDLRLDRSMVLWSQILTFAQWKREFTPQLAQAFVYRFPDALQLLGYEPDDGWIEQLGEMTEAE